MLSPQRGSKAKQAVAAEAPRSRAGRWISGGDAGTKFAALFNFVQKRELPAGTILS